MFATETKSTGDTRNGFSATMEGWSQRERLLGHLLLMALFGIALFLRTAQ